MLVAEAHCAPGAFRLSIEGHADDPAVCAAVTAFEQTAMIWLEQLAEQRGDDIQFTYFPTLEVSPS